MWNQVMNCPVKKKSFQKKRKEDENRHSSLFHLDEAQEEKIHQVLKRFIFPKLAENLLGLLDENPSMTVDELVSVEGDIFKTLALTGKAQANLEALENTYSKKANDWINCTNNSWTFKHQ